MIITLQTLIFFRESLIKALDRLLRPYYNKFSLAFGRNGEVSDDEESDEQVFAEYDDERGVVFYPPMYLQRYAAVSDCLMDGEWSGKLEKVVDLGYHDMSFIKYLKEVQGIKCILGVDLECIPLRCSMDLMGCEDYIPKRENPLEVTLFKGNAADPDYRLIGCDAVIGIEMIEHMLPHDLDRLIHTVFGFIKPWVAIFTTPNGDFNVLFKALERNGLRRLDHFFEWSQDQFHDWCSNIVCRYPQYTVSCRGIGPGPNGTKHLGCCSQMAVFVSKEYNKQQDLNINSLALVTDSPSPDSVSNLISSWETPDIPTECNMIEPPKNAESYSELQSEGPSSITILLTTPSNSSDTIPYQDKMSQCNLDSETERSFLMFDYEQMCFDVVKPRRNRERHRVYYIEDVYNRLNCSTLEVKKFSKTTQNLMAKNKVDTLVHTREVVDEIRHLTKMLNFSREPSNQLENGTHTWCNINWGDNAPYWNQYYKVVKAYNYPFEVKSEECRILDLISDEINRLIDAQFEEDFSFEVNRMEIPIEHLMRVVEHITDDVDKVKDLLEWNGYEILGNVVIHSRMVVDYSSAGTQEDDSQETSDIYSDWDSTSISDGSTIIADYHARCLRRALDQKVRRLRSMLSADEDITTELDQVVCRLMKLALRTSKGRNTPPPTRWMQCKLLDLLTLTEKTIERRKRHFIESYPLKTINFEEKSQEMMALERIKEDNTALKIVDKYKHLVNEDDVDAKYRYLDFDLDDDLSALSADFEKDYEFINKHPDSPDLRAEAASPDTKMFQLNDLASQGESKLERTQAWVEDDVEVVPYPIHNGNFDNSSIDTDHIASKVTKYYKKRYKGKQCVELNCLICKKTRSRTHKQFRIEEKCKDNNGTKIVKKVTRKKSSNHSLGLHSIHKKYVSVDYKTYRVKPRKKQHKSPSRSKPIPASLMELCHMETIVNEIGPYNTKTHEITKIDQENTPSVNLETEVADTKQSMLIDIITEDTQETIALCRTIGTDADAGSMVFEEETLIRSVSNTLMNEEDMFEKHVVTENVQSQTIFLYDINEPTTSKGIRHIGMDVQCGPDATAPTYSMLSATTSLTRVPKMFAAGIKIEDSTTDIKITNADFGTCTYDVDNNYKTLLPHGRSGGIRIKDSDSNLLINQRERCTAPTYSTLTATISLTRMPTMSVWDGNFDPKTDDKMGTTDFGACTNTPECNSYSNFPNESFVGIKIKDSISNIAMHLDSVADSEAYKSYDAPPQKCTLETTILETKSTDDSNKGSITNILSNKESCASISEIHEKLIVSSHELYQNKAKVKQDTCAKLDCNNLSLRTECLTSTLTNSDIATKKKFKKGNISKGVQKKSVDFRLQSPVPRYSKRVKCSTNIPHPRNKSYIETLQIQKPTKKVTLVKSITKHYDTVCDSIISSHILTETDCLSKNEISDISTTVTSSPNSLKEKIYVDIENILKQTDCPVNEELDSLNIPLLFSDEITCLKSHEETNIFDSTSDMYVDSVYKTSTSTVHNGDLQVISQANKIVESFGRLPTIHKKRNLSSGGVQVHSYKDEQTLSEDIMYQGQWQKNTPKVLTKRKVFSPVASRKTDTNSKKREISKKSNSKEKVCDKKMAKKSIKIEHRQPLIPLKSINTSVKPVCGKNEGQQDQNPTKTACVATVAKPFRNILKVPSKFPLSNLPSKSLQSHYNAKKPPTPPVSPMINDEKTPRKGQKKNYIPPYLRQRRLNAANTVIKTDLNLSLDSVKSKINNKNNTSQLLVKSKTEEIRRDLFKFRTRLPKPEYVVFRNEIEKKKSDGLHFKNTPNSVRKKDASRQRSSTPNSANSSTCSSPCSIATVRAVPTRTKNANSRRHSGSSYVNSTGNSGSGTSSPERNKKFIKRGKSARITVENKENIPQTSKHFNDNKKDGTKLGKATFMGHKKDVYIAQVKDSSLHSTNNALSKHKNHKSTVNIPKTESFNSKKPSPRQSTSPSHKPSIMLDAPLTVTRSNETSECSQTSNMVLVIEPHPRQLLIPTELTKVDDTKLANDFVTKEFDTEDDFTKEDIVDGESIQNVNHVMREIIEESLNFIDDSFEDMVDTETVILNHGNVSPRDDLPASPASFKTLVTSEDNNISEILPSDIEYALNQTLDSSFDDVSVMSLNDAQFTVTDFDMMSFKSVTSGSKFSGYLFADNEFTSSIKLPKCTITSPNSSSVREIYERKDQPFQISQVTNAPGALANQAFSGFTINEDPVGGDQPDLINFVDSETGSLAAAIARQATSEELLISGRSSDSFDSCMLDDDAVVPYWLFQIISQQQSDTTDSEAPGETVQMPIVEPLFDDNANMIEAPGAGAGAGDGRGIHSDHSQDSSGNGTSVSSSQTSSGPQSEAILIDPAAFAAQFEMLREAVEGSMAVLAANSTAPSDTTGSRQVTANSDPESQSYSRGESRRTPLPRAALASASDADADVSSLETDLEDYHTPDP